MLIGIGHRSGHGKDTLADFMVQQIKAKFPKHKVLKYPFAWKIKLIAYDLYKQFGVREPEYYDTLAGRGDRNVVLPKLGMTVVELWIKIGTPCFRDIIYDATWTAFVRTLANEPDTIIVAPDARFPNEVGDIDYLIKCVNPRVPDREGLSVDDNLKDFDGWDTVVVNDAGLLQLAAKSQQVVDKIPFFKWI